MDLIEGIKTQRQGYFIKGFHVLWEMDLIEGIKTRRSRRSKTNTSVELWEMDLIEGIKTQVACVMMHMQPAGYEKWTW